VKQIEDLTGADILADLPSRQLRALFNDSTITVYQAYPVEIATAAIAAQAFVKPFKLERMTWIKPSFSWMMYRSNWAQRAGQERVLAIQIYRQQFDEALANSCLSHFERAVHGSKETWLERKAKSNVVVQWDPERSISLERLTWRSIQIGLMGSAAKDYANEWVNEITDVTPSVRDIYELLVAGRADLAKKRAPVEVAYPLPEYAEIAVGASRYGSSTWVAPADRSNQSNDPNGAG